MYYLNAKVIWQNEEDLTVEVNNIGYRGKKVFKNVLELDNEYVFYLINYNNEYMNQILFFIDKKIRNLAEILLSIKNIGVLTVIKIFKNFEIEEFLKICKEQDINNMITKTKISENLSKKIIQEIRSRIFKQKYNNKQMNIINSLNRLGYKISDIYKAIENIDINLQEEKIIEQAIYNLNLYEK